jgi:hypothetical protein
MKKIIFIILYFGLAFTSFAQSERRFQIWNKNEIVFQPWKNIAVEVAEKIHYSPERNAADVQYAEFFLSHEPQKWFEYGAGFRITKINKYPGWTQEYRPMLFADFNKAYKHFSFKYSNRFEYRIFEIDLDQFRYRQEFLVEFPALTNWGMRFYTSEESFYRFDESDIHLFRIYGGLSVVKKEHFKLKIFYAFEKFKPIDTWRITDIVGLNMSFII